MNLHLACDTQCGRTSGKSGPPTCTTTVRAANEAPHASHRDTQSAWIAASATMLYIHEYV